MSLNLVDIRHDIETRETYLKRCLSILDGWQDSNETVGSKELLEQEVFFLRDQLSMLYQAAQLLQEEQPEERILETV